MSDIERGERDYSRRVGSRLRAIRRQRGLSLQEVETISAEEFRASVLGAYERGERAISVTRLQRLADLYSVPTEQLLPIETLGSDDDEDDDRLDRLSRRASRPLVIDLAALEAMTRPEAATLRRFVTMIQVDRQDFNGRVLAVRGDDLRALGAILGVAPAAVPRRVRDLGLSTSAAPPLSTLRQF